MRAFDRRAQRRSLSQRSALGMIDGDCSSDSPISLTIARLCVWSMSMRLGITKPRSGKKAPASETQRLRHLPLPQLSRLRARLAIEWNRRPPLLAILRERLFLRTAGPCNKNLWLSATCAVYHYGGDNSSERRSLAALAWFRVAACDLRLGERPGGLLAPLGPLGSTWLNHIAHPLPPIGRRVLITANSSPGFSFRTASRARLLPASRLSGMV